MKLLDTIFHEESRHKPTKSPFVFFLLTHIDNNKKCKRDKTIAIIILKHVYCVMKYPSTELLHNVSYVDCYIDIV